MIPLQLSLTGFLSYRDPVELDFTSFGLACISGPNGAGKSSLLDAITWALFGQARKRDDSLVNAQSHAAEVVFTFAYEQNVYRVQRSLPRGKSSVLEFNIRQSDGKTWKQLTERTNRETQARIVQTLRMDYDTFINASFFLQGKADQFTTQAPGERKETLGKILGLEVWDAYRQRAAARRKLVEADISSLDGRMAEINAELGEEETRRQRLEGLQAELERLGKARRTQERAVEALRKSAATLAEQRRLVDTLARQAEAAARRLEDMGYRLEQRQAERQGYAAALERAVQVEAAYHGWQAQRLDLERWNAAAERFREHEQRRTAPLTEIETEKARLTQELVTLQAQALAAAEQQAAGQALESDAAAMQAALAESQAALAQRAGWQAQLEAARQSQAEARAENPRLRAEMDELKERIGQLEALESPLCPLCGQPLGPADRLALIEKLTTQGKVLGDRFHLNQSLLREGEQQLAGLEAQVADFAAFEQQRLERGQALARLAAQQEQANQAWAGWLALGAVRLAELEQALAAEAYAKAARARLAKVDAKLKQLGYDPAAHEAARQAEGEGRLVEAEFHALDKARAALAPLEREITDLQAQRETLGAEQSRQQQEHAQAAAALAAAEAQAPDLESAEAELLSVQEQENRLRLEVGAARQKVLVLDDLKERRQALTTQREELARQVARYRQLDRAFGKDGVPALLVEQALPQIEESANNLLDRLSGGAMAVRFVTQAAYKDKNREDLRETLDIQISDGAGTRDYEMFSGGEAFRVNFAIRLALSEVLAQRAGARLQTLVIDEGFGSQDTQGRQRLIEAINLVKADFAKILVITHIDELKDAFPHRIEVEKTERGSTLQVI